jgi:hypothetical protein
VYSSFKASTPFQVIHTFFSIYLHIVQLGQSLTLKLAFTPPPPPTYHHPPQTFGPVTGIIMSPPSLAFNRVEIQNSNIRLLRLTGKLEYNFKKSLGFQFSSFKNVICIIPKNLARAFSS